MKPIYELTKEFASLLTQAEERSSRPFSAMLDSTTTGDVATDTYQYALLMEELKNRQRNVEVEYQKIADIRSRIKSAIGELNQKIKENMSRCRVQQFNTDNYIYKTQKTGGKQALEIYGEVPDAYLKIIYEPDKDKIRAALDSGKELTFARYGTKGTSLIVSQPQEKEEKKTERKRIKAEW